MLDFSHLPDKNNIDVQSFFSGAANNTRPNTIFTDNTYGTSSGTYMTYFDGIGDRLKTTTLAYMQLTGNFTVECSFMAMDNLTANVMFAHANVGLVNITTTLNASLNLCIFISSGILKAFVSGNATLLTGPTVRPFIWYHVALVRLGSINTLYLNGLPVATSSVTPTWDTAPSIGVGTMYNTVGSFNFKGYISNVRIVKGTAVYTSAFTPSTTPLTRVANTIFLTCQDLELIDNSSNNYTITATGVANNNVKQPNAFVPNANNYVFDDKLYKIGLNGTSDYLSIGHNQALDLSAGVASVYTQPYTGAPSFTIECWFYCNALSAGNQNIINKDAVAGSAYTQYGIQITDAGLLRLVLGHGNNASVANGSEQWFTILNSITLHTWYHVAACQVSPNQVYVFLNGKFISKTTRTQYMADGGKALLIGYSADQAANECFNGYISNLRIVKGTALYTESFTPSTIPLVEDRELSIRLLTCKSNTIIDTSTANAGAGFSLTTYGSAEVDTLNPFGTTARWTGYSNFFDGTMDYLTTPTSATNTMTGQDFTVECWAYPTSIPSQAGLVGINNTSNSGLANFGMFLATDRKITVFFNGNATTYSSTGFFVTLNAWNHIAFVRSGSTNTVYLNGVSVITNSVTPTWSGSPVITVGRLYGDNTGVTFFGYLSNVRVVKGTAVYTSAFTPSTTPLTAITNTHFLSCQSYRLIDNSINNFTLTKNGSVSIKELSPFGSMPDEFRQIPISYSNYFDGVVGTSISTDVDKAFNIGAPGVDFTVEGWFYFNSLSIQTQEMFAFSGATAFNPYMFVWNNGNIYFRSAETSGEIVTTFASGMSVGVWYHWAITKLGNLYTIYKNGTAVANNTSTAVVDENKSFSVGRKLSGNISNVRVIKGTALYNGFTPSTKPLTAIANTSLLTCEDARIIDKSSNNFTISQATIGSVTSTVTVSPMTGASVGITSLEPEVLATDIPNWQTWIKPRGVNWVYIIGVGGGASGVGGTHSAVNNPSARPGGAGGGSGAQTVMMLPAALLPPVLYIHLGQGGRQRKLSSGSLSVPGGPTYIAVEPLTIGIANNSQLLLLTANGATGQTGGAATAIADNFPLAGRAIKVINIAGQSGTAGATTGAANGISLILPSTGLMVTGGTGGGGKSINYTVTSMGGNIAGIPTATSIANTNMHVGYIPTSNGGTSSITSLADGGPGQAGYKFSNWLHLGGTGGGGGGTANTGLGSSGGAGGHGAPGCGGGGSGSGGTFTGLPGSGGDGFVHIISF